MQMDELKCRKRVLRRYALPNLYMYCNVCLVFCHIAGYFRKEFIFEYFTGCIPFEYKLYESFVIENA